MFKVTYRMGCSWYEVTISAENEETARTIFKNCGAYFNCEFIKAERIR